MDNKNQESSGGTQGDSFIQVSLGPPTRYEGRFILEPVGLDVDGVVRPINEMFNVTPIKPDGPIVSAGFYEPRGR